MTKENQTASADSSNKQTPENGCPQTPKVVILNKSHPHISPLTPFGKPTTAKNAYELAIPPLDLDKVSNAMPSKPSVVLLPKINRTPPPELKNVMPIVVNNGWGDDGSTISSKSSLGKEICVPLIHYQQLTPAQRKFVIISESQGSNFHKVAEEAARKAITMKDPEERSR